MKVSLAMFAVVLGLSLGADAQARLADPDSAGGVLYLGKVEVNGQQRIIAALQAIKVALKRPESSDPSQRGAVVCRIEKDIGSHQQELLTCATNNTLSLRRQGAQNAFLIGCDFSLSCSASALEDNSVLGMAISSAQGHVLRVPVSGASLRKVLAALPDPAPAQTTPPAPSTAAPPSR